MAIERFSWSSTSTARSGCAFELVQATETRRHAIKVKNRRKVNDVDIEDLLPVRGNGSTGKRFVA